MSTLTLRLSSYAAPARGYVHAAQTLADERGHREVEPLHLLAVLVDRDALTRDAITKANLELTDVLIETEHLLRKRARVNTPALLSQTMLDLLGRAEGEAARQGGRSVSTRDLLLALATEQFGGARDVMRATGLSAPILRALLDTLPDPPAGTETSRAVAGAAAALGSPVVPINWHDVSRTTRCSSASPGLARRPSCASSRHGSRAMTCRLSCGASGSSRSTSAHSWQAQNFAGSLRNACAHSSRPYAGLRAG